MASVSGNQVVQDESDVDEGSDPTEKSPGASTNSTGDSESGAAPPRDDNLQDRSQNDVFTGSNPRSPESYVPVAVPDVADMLPGNFAGIFPKSSNQQ